MSTIYEYREGTLYFNESGRWRKGELATCPVCGTQFAKRIGQSKKYCSKECAAKARKQQIELSCDCCGKKFTRRSSKINTSKSGLHFCSRKCKESVQRLDSNHPKAHLIRPEHFGNEKHRHYQSMCKRIKSWACEDCGEDRSYMLCVHHIDGDRGNNPIDGSNWEVLCRNCHCTRHLKVNESGEYIYDSSSLTPRELIKSM